MGKPVEQLSKEEKSGFVGNLQQFGRVASFWRRGIGVYFAYKGAQVISYTVWQCLNKSCRMGTFTCDIVIEKVWVTLLWKLLHSLSPESVIELLSERGHYTVFEAFQTHSCNLEKMANWSYFGCKMRLQLSLLWYCSVWKDAKNVICDMGITHYCNALWAARYFEVPLVGALVELILDYNRVTLSSVEM